MKTFYAFRTTEDRQHLVDIAIASFGAGNELNSRLFDRMLIEVTMGNSDFAEVVEEWRNTKILNINKLKSIGLNDEQITYLSENIYKY